MNPRSCCHGKCRKPVEKPADVLCKEHLAVLDAKVAVIADRAHLQRVANRVKGK